MKRQMLTFLSLCLLLLGWPAQADLARRRSWVVEVVEKASPAVVHIGTVQMVERRFRSPLSPFFDEFFGGRDRQQAVEGLGSGVLVDASGTIVTNEHVIRGAAEIHVILADGRQLNAEVIGSDADNDIAVLKVSSKAPLPFVALGTSGDLMIGETVVAMGSPLGLKKTVTSGVISALGRSLKAEDRLYNDFIQTDASINPGNSGGPLLNVDAQVIGINTAIIASAQGIGFAIPADKVRRIVAELTQFGKMRPAWVGVEVEPLTPPLARRLGWDRNFGALLSGIEENSPAARSGLKVGDIVMEVSRSQVESAEDFEVRMRSYPAGTPISVTVFRAGQKLSLKLDAEEFPKAMAETLAWSRLGLRVRPSSGGLALVAVRPGSNAAQVGLAPGDALLRVNNKGMDSLETFRETLIDARRAKSVLLLIRRGRTGYYVTLPFQGGSSG